ncbi:Hsp33 family molecular chaperone HslO [Ectothiorhodospiraceae bacterium 2226]|nr:Hsp33 family molecular chaperone HslO [Ectothiorhodospiraceae bacterium 2226]
MDLTRHNDSLQRFLFEQAAIRGEVVHLDATWQEVLRRQDYPTVVRDLLGELTAAAALLSSTLKYEGSLTLQIEGKGPLYMMVVECTSERTIRALARWAGEVPAGSLRQATGEGRLAITIEPRHSPERYQGIVSLEGDTLAEALQEYLMRSEQLDTRLWLTATPQGAAGMLLQRLPRDHSGEDPDIWNRAQMLAETVKREELLELHPLQLVRRLFHEEDVRLFEPEPMSFRCSCSRERVSAMLRGLGHEEVQSIIEEQSKVEVTCEFCGATYRFDPVDAEQLFAADASAPPVPPTRH